MRASHFQPSHWGEQLGAWQTTKPACPPIPQPCQPLQSPLPYPPNPCSAPGLATSLPPSPLRQFFALLSPRSDGLSSVPSTVSRRCTAGEPNAAPAAPGKSPVPGQLLPDHASRQVSNPSPSPRAPRSSASFPSSSAAACNAAPAQQRPRKQPEAPAPQGQGEGTAANAAQQQLLLDNHRSGSRASHGSYPQMDAAHRGTQPHTELLQAKTQPLKHQPPRQALPGPPARSHRARGAPHATTPLLRAPAVQARLPHYSSKARWHRRPRRSACRG